MNLIGHTETVYTYMNYPRFGHGLFGHGRFGQFFMFRPTPNQVAETGKITVAETGKFLTET